jgi:hypothetical protein
MPWRRNTSFSKVQRAASLAAVILLLGTTACTKQEAVDTLGRSMEATVRAACENARNCQNSCPDGSTARGPFYRCR